MKDTFIQRVIEGRGIFDKSLLTGGHQPVVKIKNGGNVFAGFNIYYGYIEIALATVVNNVMVAADPLRLTVEDYY